MSNTFVPLLHHYTGPPIDLSSTPEPMPRLGPPNPAVDLDAERDAAFSAGATLARDEAATRIAELEAQLLALAPLLPEVERARKAALVQASEDVAALVLELAQRVLGASLAIHPEALPGLVRAAIERLPDEDELWIRVPPDVVERVSAAISDRHRSRVKGDPALTTGCVVETRHVSIDASLEAVSAGIAEATQAWLAGVR
jgi:flagellar biosynthesis/type III secretory pathway protein FliH